MNDQDDDQPQGPAVSSELHQWNRKLFSENGKEIIGKKGCRKWSPLEAAYARGQLGALDSGMARDRLTAGLSYSTLYDTAQSAGRDSTQAFGASRSSGSGGIGNAQADAIMALVAIDSHMGSRDRLIVRSVCGEGHFPSEAVAMVAPGYAKATTPRFCEALDALCEAMERHKRQPRKFNGGVTA